MDVRWKIEGAAEMSRLMKQLGPAVAIKAGDRALKAGAKPILDEVRRRAPVLTGAYKRAIAAQMDTRGNRSRNDARRILLGVRRGAGQYRILHLLEFGHANAAARPHWRPSMNAKVGEALSEIGRVLAAQITEECDKAAKPGRR